MQTNVDEEQLGKMKQTVDAVDEEEAAVRSTAQKLYRPAPSCGTPNAGESPETTAFLSPRHGRERIGEDRWRLQKRTE